MMNLKLQEICLRGIILTFDTYLPCFYAKDVKLKQLFTFLLRVYSEEIISNLYDLHQLEFKHADVLINKYLTSINTDWFRTQNWEIISTKMASIGPTLKKIYVHRSIGELPWKDVLCYLPNLELIYSELGSCTDEVLECVAKFCPNVVELNLLFSFISLRGIKHLGMQENGSISCPKLKRLSIRGANIDKEGVEYILKNFPYLEEIDHHILHLVLFETHKRDMLQAHKTVSFNLTSLQMINAINHPDYNDLLRVCVSVCPHLKELECEIRTVEHLDALSNLKNLTKLALRSYCGSPLLNVNGLLKCIGSTFKSLSLADFTVSVPVLADSCSRLEKLVAMNINFETGDETSVPVFHHLSSITFLLLKDRACFREACALLSASYRLTHVRFPRYSLSSEMETELLNALRYCPLRIIHFDHHIDYDSAMKILESSPNLSALKLESYPSYSTEFKRDLKAKASTLPGRPIVYID